MLKFTLININLLVSKIKAEKRLREEQEKELNRLRNEKNQWLQLKNEEIRKKNAMRFSSKQSRINPQIPWGYDQKKVINKVKKIFFHFIKSQKRLNLLI
jgi:hypothetical protein